jgi:hypothetical protein
LFIRHSQLLVEKMRFSPKKPIILSLLRVGIPDHEWVCACESSMKKTREIVTGVRIPDEKTLR